MLSPHYTVGRAPGCDLRLSSRKVSGTHASLCWHGSTWSLHDLASTNGSWIDDHKLDKGEYRTVLAGSMLLFGDQENAYELIDDAPPRASAIATDGTRVDAVDDLLILPGADSSEVTVRRQDGEWWLDAHPERRLVDQDELAVGGRTWTLSLPRVSEPTTDVEPHGWWLKDITLRFFVSRDFEHVDLELDNGTRVLRMRQHVYWYTLLVLAHHRHRELAQGIPESEAGWISVTQLYRELRGSQQPSDVLNHHVHRAKKEFKNVNITDYDRVIERRVASRQIRTGATIIEIHGAWQ